MRARRSLAQIPHRGSGIDIDKENVTTDFSAAQKQSNMPSRASGNDKRSRSKSLGPGGLDLLKNGGNDRRKVRGFVCLCVRLWARVNFPSIVNRRCSIEVDTEADDSRVANKPHSKLCRNTQENTTS